MPNQAWLYVVLLGAVIAVAARMMSRKTQTAAPTAGAPSVQEMEETLDHFVAEMEQENEKLLSAIAQMKQEHVLQTDRMNGRIDFLEKQVYDLSQELRRITVHSAQLQTAYEHLQQQQRLSAAVPAPAPEPQPAAEPEPQLMMQMKRRYPELFELFQQGKSIDVIAKKLGMNKGEVNLIVQLARQEEQSRV